MSKRPGAGSRQRELFPLSKKPAIAVDAQHPLVRITELLDWDELLDKVEEIRAARVKSRAGRPPHLRALLGAVILRATKKMTFREAEDQIRYYAPARYLCGLSESEWTPDHDTIHEFTQSLGEEGVKLINEYVVKLAVVKKLADPSVAVGDITVQEAAIPYPSEMRLMAAFLSTVAACGARGGRVLQQLLAQLAPAFAALKAKIRGYHLFAQTKEKKDHVMWQVARAVERVRARVQAALHQPLPAPRSGRVAAARDRLSRVTDTMGKLLPQIRHWLRTGFVAKNKIISLQIPETHAVVRGKVGKKVEFGFKWGFTRLRGGYLLAKRGHQKLDIEDKRFVVDAVDDLKALFGRAPRDYAYDRGGFGVEALKRLQERGVRNVAVAPVGKHPWVVSERVRRRMVKERAAIEAGIGSVKCGRYGFNKPNARSAKMMGIAGHLGVLGFNLTKLAREVALA
jgi:transposase, IS5 family